MVYINQMMDLYMKDVGKTITRDGFGMAILANNKLKIGEWKNNIYKGERPYYTSERIYGIDISKYQHIVGRKRYGINRNQFAYHKSWNIR